MKLNKYKIALAALAMSFASCESYLDVSDEQMGGITKLDDIFENVSYTKQFYSEVFAGKPDYFDICHASWDAGGLTGLDNPWAGMCDEVYTSASDNVDYMVSERNSQTMGFHRWGPLYKAIRQANLLMENIKPIYGGGISASELLPETVKEYKVSSRFMRAYYHFLLFEQYGPIPIMDHSLTPNDDLDVPRNSVDEVVNWIDSEIKACIPDMIQNAPTVNEGDDEYRAHPNKGVALALLAKLHVFAASKLYNGGWPAAVALKNNDGKSLFPTADSKKWETALTACKNFIDYAEGKGQGSARVQYQIYQAYIKDASGNNTSVKDPHASVYDIFQKWTVECIWANTENGASNGLLWGDRLERRSYPRCETNGLGSNGVYQDAIDDFFCADGLPTYATPSLPKSPTYNPNRSAMLEYPKSWGVQESEMAKNIKPVNGRYLDREPRFYSSVMFLNRIYHRSKGGQINFLLGGNCDKTNHNPKAGAYMYKFMNHNVSMSVNPQREKIARPSVIFRLGEFYLLYAEALNEAADNAGNRATAVKYLNVLRERAGIAKLDVLNPAITSSQAILRDAIMRERRVELFAEGQRYFDVRRWMIANADLSTFGGQYGNVMGPDMNNATTEKDFFTYTVQRPQVFREQYYIHPIPYYEMQKSKNLVQNPMW